MVGGLAGLLTAVLLVPRKRQANAVLSLAPELRLNGAEVHTSVPVAECRVEIDNFAAKDDPMERVDAMARRAGVRVEHTRTESQT